MQPFVQVSIIWLLHISPGLCLVLIVLMLTDEQLPDETTLKKKIKSLMDVFKTEVQKVEKSKGTGSSAASVYTPKLQWFKAADYLLEHCITRTMSCNLVNIHTYIHINLTIINQYYCSL